MDEFYNLLKNLGLHSIDGYNYGRVLGTGGQGTVCEYRSPDGDRMAIKFLVSPPGTPAVRRLMAEAKALLECRRLEGLLGKFVVMGRSEARQAPNLPVHYFGMDVASGTSLADMVKTTKPPWAWRDALSAVGRIATSLSRVHVAGYVHRDFHPGNIFISEPVLGADFILGDTAVETFPGVTILDLGVHSDWRDHFMPREKGDSTLTFRPVGAIRYASPESLETPSETSPASDVWSLGVILYQLLAGDLPFEAKTYLEKIQLIVAGTYQSPTVKDARPGERACILDILSMMLEPEPALRVPTGMLPKVVADALHHDLAGAFGDDWFRREYLAARGDLWLCPNCRAIVAPKASRCTQCGHSDDEWPHWSSGRGR